MSRMRIISRRTKLINNHPLPIVVRGMRNNSPIEKFNVTIPGSEHKFVYYDDLNVNFNYSMASVEAFVENENHTKITLETVHVQSNEALVFDCVDGQVTFKPIKGNTLSRIWLFKWLWFVPSPIPENNLIARTDTGSIALVNSG